MLGWGNHGGRGGIQIMLLVLSSDSFSFVYHHMQNPAVVPSIWSMAVR